MFDGIEHQLEITEPALGNASHGFRPASQLEPRGPHVRARRAVGRRGTSQGLAAIRLQLTVAYEVGADGLTVTHTATNKGATSSPFGLGMHTFIRAGDFPLDECALHLAAGTRLPIDPAEDAAERVFAGSRRYGLRLPDTETACRGAVGHSVQRIGRRRRQWSHATRAAGSGWNGHCPCGPTASSRGFRHSSQIPPTTRGIPTVGAHWLWSR